MNELKNKNGISVKDMYEFLGELIKNGKSNYNIMLEIGDENYNSTEIQIYDDESVVNIL